MEVCFRSLPPLLLKVLNVYIAICGRVEIIVIYSTDVLLEVPDNVIAHHWIATVRTVTTFETTYIESPTVDNVMCISNQCLYQSRCPTPPNPTYTHTHTTPLAAAEVTLISSVE